MKITANLMGVTCDAQFVGLGDTPGAVAITVKIQEVGGRAARVVLSWSDALDTWEAQILPVHKSVPLLPVVLPPKPWGEEIVIDVDAAPRASVKMRRAPRKADPLSAVPAAPLGFLGKRGRVLGEADDGLHVVRLAEYEFPDGSVVPYAELHETHDGQYPGRVMALSVLVHLAQNVGASEVWEINNREGPPEETDTPAPRFSAMVAEALAQPGAITQRALAVATGVDEGNLSAWLAGRRPIPVRAIEAMFARLGILPRASA